MIERRLFKGFSILPAASSSPEILSLEQQLAVMNDTATRLRDDNAAIASDAGVLASKLVIVSELIEQLTAQLSDLGARPRPVRLSGTLSVTGLLAIGKSVRTANCAGLKVGDFVAVQPKADLPVALLLGAGRCDTAGKLRIEVATLIAVTLPATTIELDVMAWR